MQVHQGQLAAPGLEMRLAEPTKHVTIQKRPTPPLEGVRDGHLDPQNGFELADLMREDGERAVALSVSEYSAPVQAVWAGPEQGSQIDHPIQSRAIGPARPMHQGMVDLVFGAEYPGRLAHDLVRQAPRPERRDVVWRRVVGQGAPMKIELGPVAGQGKRRPPVQFGLGRLFHEKAGVPPPLLDEEAGGTADLGPMHQNVEVTHGTGAGSPRPAGEHRDALEQEGRDRGGSQGPHHLGARLEEKRVADPDLAVDALEPTHLGGAAAALLGSEVDQREDPELVVVDVVEWDERLPRLESLRAGLPVQEGGLHCEAMALLDLHDRGPVPEHDAWWMALDPLPRLGWLGTKGALACPRILPGGKHGGRSRSVSNEFMSPEASLTILEVAVPRCAAEVMSDEVVALNVETGIYFSIRELGVAAWNDLASGYPVEHLLSCMRTVSGSEGSLLGFVAEIRRHGLMRASPARDPRGEPTLVAALGTGQRDLVLETFEDMKDLILSDPIHDVDETRGWPNRASGPG